MKKADLDLQAPLGVRTVLSIRQQNLKGYSKIRNSKGSFLKKKPMAIPDRRTEDATYQDNRHSLARNVPIYSMEPNHVVL